MTPIIATAYYRATIPLSVGRVRNVDSSYTFDAYAGNQLTSTERLNALRILARQRIAEHHGISPLLVVVRDISTDTLGKQERQLGRIQ